MNYGRYSLVKELGKGSMGVVYLAHDPDIDRPLALKVLRPDRVTSEDFVQRFLKEARAVGRLSHPGIVTVYDVGQDHGTIYIAMELIEGQPLNEIMRERRLTLPEILEFGVHLAEILDYAHSRGIVHRDIKPPNILMTLDGKIKITDFGIARIEDTAAEQQTRLGEVLGTPVYMSPEQTSGQTVDGRTDLYSLGVILYELVTGSRPYTGETLAALFRAITETIPTAPLTLQPEIPPGLSEVIMRCLKKDPDERFGSGAELSQALNTVLGAPPEEAPPNPGRRAWLVAGLTLTLIGTALAGWLFLLPGRPAPGPAPPTLAMLQVESLPPGAQVFIDGSFRGQAPCDLPVPVGKHEVRLSLAGHYPWEAQVNLEETSLEPLFVRLVPVE